MGAFSDACLVETRGIPLARDLLLSIYDVTAVIFIKKGRLQEALQSEMADFLVEAVDGRQFFFECKFELRHTGNFFLETWSNARARNPGWMVKSRADLLIYGFLESGIFYVIDFPRLWGWAYSREGDRLRYEGFPPACQAKYKQLNDTWGRLVPIDVVRREVGFRCFIYSGGSWIEGEAAR